MFSVLLLDRDWESWAISKKLLKDEGSQYQFFVVEKLAELQSISVCIVKLSSLPVPARRRSKLTEKPKLDKLCPGHQKIRQGQTESEEHSKQIQLVTRGDSINLLTLLQHRRPKLQIDLVLTASGLAPRGTLTLLFFQEAELRLKNRRKSFLSSFLEKDSFVFRLSFSRPENIQNLSFSFWQQFFFSLVLQVL